MRNEPGEEGRGDQGGGHDEGSQGRSWRWKGRVNRGVRIGSFVPKGLNGVSWTAGGRSGGVGRWISEIVTFCRIVA